MANAAAEIINEEWRPVVGYEGWYEVSSLGRVRRVKPGRGTRPGRIRKAFPTRDGYLVLFLSRGSIQRPFSVHRLVVEAFIGPIPGNMEVNHLNGVRGDPRLANLEIVTTSQNLTHSFRVLGRRNISRRGEATGTSKLTSAQVTAIRERRANGERVNDLAREFGVDRHCISSLVNRRSWTHIP